MLGLLQVSEKVKELRLPWSLLTSPIVPEFKPICPIYMEKYKLKVLFSSSMAFHYRSLLPIMKLLCEQGDEVVVLSKGRFSEDKIRKKPRSFGAVTKSSLEFVCSQIGLSKEFLSKVRFVRISRRFGIPTSRFYKSVDLFVSTTKGFPWLNKMAEFGRPRLAIGYQNFLGTYFFTESGCFPETCPPELTFEKEVRAQTNATYVETGLPFLDSYVSRYKKSTQKNKASDKILLLHPGGYRNVLTRMGESRESSYKKQIELYRSIISAVPNEKSLHVKIHPLAARYHDMSSHMDFAADLNVTPVDGFLGDVLFDYDAVLSIGSSALYEVLPFGIPLWYLNYFSNERTQLYSELPSILVDSGKELEFRLKNNVKPLFTQEFERVFVNSLMKTADGNASERVMQIINNKLTR